MHGSGLIGRGASAPEQRPRAEDDNATGVNHRPLSGFGIETGPPSLLPQRKFPKACEFHLLTTGQGLPNGVEEGLHQALAFALGKAYHFMEVVGDILFGDGHGVSLHNLRSLQKISAPKN